MADEDFDNENQTEREKSPIERELERRTVRQPASGSNDGLTPKPRTLMGRLFGSPKPKSDTKETAQAPKPKSTFSVDLSGGTIRGKDLMNRSKFRHSMNDQLRGAVKSAGLRKDVIGRLADKRTHGLGKGEVKRELRQMRKDGTISRVQERNIRKDMGVSKRPGIF